MTSNQLVYPLRLPIILLVFFQLPLVTTPGQDSAKNSTKKMRVQPSELAVKAGSAVKWSQDFAAAVENSRQSRKPIFWYVPTIRGTFMDRKPVIDRYMMAGYFSWPRVIHLLNTHFVPVKAAPTREQQKVFELSRYKFVEPGFLILGHDGTLNFKVDRLTTQHIGWLLHILAQQTSNEKLQLSIKKELDLFPIGFEYHPTAIDPEWPADPDEATKDLLVHQMMFAAMAQFRSGQHAAAKKTWLSLAEKAPDHPLSWKAAAEAQGIGPFSRGFEVFTELTPNILEAGIKSTGSTAPANTFTANELWQRGVDFLLAMQNENGGYVDSNYDFGGTDSLPNVHVATTALVGMALLQARSRVPSEKTAEIDAAIKKCFLFVTNEKNINRIDRDEILWADAYRLRFICRYQNALKNTLGEDIRRQVQDAATALENIQSKRGTWYHEYENPFVTATALCALYEAKQAGASFDEQKVELGLNALSKDRTGNGAYPYYSRRRRSAKQKEESIPAAAGRMPVCELALLYWGKSDQSKLTHAVQKSFEFHRNLDVALKYDNHTSTLGYGGFFYWYDMRSRAEAIAAIEDDALRRSMFEKLEEIVMRLPEIDGCFVDSHELGRCYGTAMALLCLARIDEFKKNNR